MTVRLTQIDGKLPNLALMKLASWHRRRLYTAWDNLNDEHRFFRGVETLARHGIPPRRLMVYMMIGYDQRETWERVFYRFDKMVAQGIKPYPMVYGDRKRGLPLGGHNGRIAKRTLGEFERWVKRKKYQFIPFEAYDVNARGRMPVGQTDMLEAIA